MPTKGTTNTPIRLGPEDKGRITAIRGKFGLPSDAAAVRYAIRQAHEALYPPPLPPPSDLSVRARKAMAKIGDIRGMSAAGLVGNKGVGKTTASEILNWARANGIEMKP